MKQFYYNKSRNTRDLIFGIIHVLVIFYMIFFLKISISDKWFIFILLIILWIPRLIYGYFKNINRIVLEYDKGNLNCHSVNAVIPWKEVKSITLNYRTFSESILIITTLNLDNNDFSILKKIAHFIFRIKEAEYKFVINLRYVEGYYKDVYEEIEKAFEESKT